MGKSVAEEGKGYYEDRRPSSDIDPYLATSAMFDSALFGGSDRFKRMVEFVSEGSPNMFLNKEKLAHYTRIAKEKL